MKSYYILDTETTGIDNPEVIQISILTSDGEEFNSTVRPTGPILPGATTVHGITDEKAKTFPPPEEVAMKLKAFLKETGNKSEKPRACIGHNLPFDILAMDTFLQPFRPGDQGFNPANTVCTFLCAQKLIPKDKIGSYGLDACYYYFFRDLAKLRRLRREHDSMIDVKMTKEILEELIKILPEEYDKSLTGLITFFKTPVLLDVWPIGKQYSGKPFDSADNAQIGFAKWFLKQEWADERPDLIYTIEQVYGLKK
jgi:DNA polymerase III epsilon subunit-like protein